jgi:membrane dipeptidase
VDGHNDLPWKYREYVRDNVSAIDIGVEQLAILQTDIPRLRKGHVGGQFWSVYVGCNYANKDAVRATQEQIDVVYQMVAQYPSYFQLAKTADDIINIFAAGKVLLLKRGGFGLNHLLTRVISSPH